MEQYQNDLKIAQAHFAAGTKPKYDVTKAQTQVSQAQLQLIKAENGVSLAKTALTVLMNAPGHTADYNVVDILDYSEYPADVNAVLNKAFTTRPDLLSLQKQAESANLNLSAAKADRYPS